MQKRIIAQERNGASDFPQWLDLATATVEISSEDPAHPIERALFGDDQNGWRAGEPGEQTVRIFFDKPQHLRRISVEFAEATIARTQEFVLRWSGVERSGGEIVRQQWNFSPDGATRQAEDYHVDLPDATMLELTINPDNGGNLAHASLRRLRLA